MLKKYAVLNDIKVIGSIGILIKAKNAGYIQQIKPLLEKIIDAGIYISDNLVVEVLKMCDEV